MWKDLGDAVDYYTLENGVLRKIQNLELRILLKYLAVLMIGLIVGCMIFWFLGEITTHLPAMAQNGSTASWQVVHSLPSPHEMLPI